MKYILAIYLGSVMGTWEVSTRFDTEEDCALAGTIVMFLTEQPTACRPDCEGDDCEKKQEQDS